MGKLTDQEKIDIVVKYKTGEYTYTELGNYYHVTRKAVSYIVKSREPELKTIYRKKQYVESLSETIINSMIDDYQINKSCKLLSEKYNINRLTVSKILKRNNVIISKRKYTINEHYFDSIDTEEKAYFLGLLYADGCNSENIGVSHISLIEDDRDILDKFNLAIGSNKPLSFRDRGYGKEKDNKNRKNQYSLIMVSKQISKRLAELGCPQRKTLILKFPTEEQVPKHLLRHFIRGYHDGDGCITFGYYGSRKKNQKYFNAQCNIVSTQDFCLSFQKYIKNEIDVNVCVNKNPRKGHNLITRPASVNGNLNCNKYLDWLYSGAIIYLQRKYDKYQEFKKIYFGS